MAEHNLLGKEGENEAVNYLISNEYKIRHRNWRCGKKELDIVAEKDDEIIIVEVKTRRNTAYEYPEDAVDNLKIRRIVAAADSYLRLFSLDNFVRFDIITIVGDKNNFRIEHIKEAFYPPIW